MSYEVPESSVADGRPYFLYQFTRGATVTRFTSEPVTINRDAGDGAFDWDPSPIIHGELEQTGDIEKTGVDLVLPLSNEFARSFLASASQITTLTIFRGHHTDLSNELRSVWKGRVVGAKSRRQEITVAVESVFSSMRRTGCRARVQVPCRWAQYHTGCRLTLGDWEVAGTVSAIDGVDLTITAAASSADQHYRAGIVRWGDVYGFVESQVGSAIILVSEMPGLEEEFDENGPVSVMIAPGCRQSFDRCSGIFANHLNYGGFKDRSPINPFDVSIV